MMSSTDMQTAMDRHKVQSFDEYADLVRRSGIVEKDHLNRIIEHVRRAEPDSGDSIVLARRLQDENLVTRWQNSHLLEGRSKGFFLGKYKLLDFLGTGGMSTVYLAEHVMMRRKVAIKVLLEAQTDEVTLERFRRECQVVATLDHPNIVRAHDFDSDGKFHYLVMEFVEGPSLEQLVDRKGTLPYRVAADFIRQAATGLAHAHEAGMVHRDIKPSNLLLDPKGIVKVLDMGVARILAVDDSLTLASNQNLLGTIDYLAPEQALNSHNVDSRADVYSLGCTFYYLLTGHPPFPEGVQAQKLLAHQMQQPEPLPAQRPDIPEPLVHVCERMMEKRPADRYASMQEVAESLETWSQPLRKQSGGNVLDAVRESMTSPTADTRAGRSTISVNAPMVRVTCGGCHTAFGAPGKAAGRRVKCPKCGYPIFIPPPVEITEE